MKGRAEALQGQGPAHPRCPECGGGLWPAREIAADPPLPPRLWCARCKTTRPAAELDPDS